MGGGIRRPRSARQPHLLLRRRAVELAVRRRSRCHLGFPTMHPVQYSEDWAASSDLETSDGLVRKTLEIAAALGNPYS